MSRMYCKRNSVLRSENWKVSTFKDPGAKDKHVQKHKSGCTEDGRKAKHLGYNRKGKRSRSHQRQSKYQMT